MTHADLPSSVLEQHARPIVFCQLAALLLSGMVLDGGLTLRLCVVAMIAHWTTVLILLLRSEERMGRWDRWLFRWGMLPCFVLAVAIQSVMASR